MANKQKKSVDYYIDGLAEILEGILDEPTWLRISSKAPEMNELYQKAMAMHKEQVISFNTQFNQHEIDALTNNTKLLTREEFYHEIFGGAL